MNHWLGAIEYGDGAGSPVGVAVHVRGLGWQQPVGLPPDLMGGAVVDPQGVRAAADVDPQGSPGERRRASGRPEPRAARKRNSATPMSCASSTTQNSNGGCAIFASWRSRRPNRRGSVRSRCSSRAAATLEKTDQTDWNRSATPAMTDRQPPLGGLTVSSPGGIG